MIHTDFLVAPAGEILGFRMEGHADTAPAGEDLVCAAVSSAAFLVANTVTDVLHLPAELTVDEGTMSLRVSEGHARACRDLFAGFRLHMQGLEEQYPRSIRVNMMEV